jgi:hypothetical protein
MLGYGGNGSRHTSWIQLPYYDGWGFWIMDDIWSRYAGKFSGVYRYGRPVVGMWYHWVVTTDSVNGTRTYINGRFVSAEPPGVYFNNTNTDTCDLVFGSGVNYDGKGPYNGGPYPSGSWDDLWGTLDDIRIYDCVLSPEEILNLYHANGYKVPTALTLISPPNNFMSDADHVALEWNRPLDIERFMLEVSTDSAFAESTVDSSLTNKAYTSAGLTLNQWYWWRVTAYFTNEGWGPVSKTRRFMYCPKPSTVELVSPLDDEISVVDTMKLVWTSAHPLVDRYWVEYSTNSLFLPKIVDSLVTDTSYVLRHLDTDMYWWRVKAHNVRGWNEFERVRSFEIQPLLPTAITLLSPDDESLIDTTTITLKWSPSVIGQNLGYGLEIATDSSFSNVVVDTFTTTTEYRFGGIDSNQYYWWRVRAKNTIGWGSHSEVRTIVYMTLPTVVELSYPINDSVQSVVNVELGWLGSSAFVDKYWVEISADQNFVFNSIDSSVTDTVYTLHGLTNITYWWRVRAHNRTGWSEFSETRSFKVVVTDVGDGTSTPTEYNLSQNYPNPFNPSTEIQYTIPTTTSVSLKVYNNTSQEVGTLVSEKLSPGTYTVRWDATGLSSGVYFYRIIAGDYVNTKTMLLLK